MDRRCIENLSTFGYEIVVINENPNFDAAVSAHPDMNVLQIGTRIFSCTNVHISGIHIVPFINGSNRVLEYPGDVLLNAVCVGNDFICRKASIATDALSYAEQLGFRIINVNQGYTKCNICVVDNDNKAVMTEDEGIERILSAHGYDVLLLRTHEVKLHPYKNGFIGGASGMIDNKIVFAGDITKHSEYLYIKRFCEKYGKETVSLSGSPLYDFGSVLVLDI